MTLTIKDLREIINKKSLKEDAIVTDMQLQDFVHITHDTEGNIRLCTSKPIGRCNRTGEYVYPSVADFGNPDSAEVAKIKLFNDQYYKLFQELIQSGDWYDFDDDAVVESSEKLPGQYNLKRIR